MPDEHDRPRRELVEAVWDDYDEGTPRPTCADWLDSVNDPADARSGVSAATSGSPA